MSLRAILVHAAETEDDKWSRQPPGSRRPNTSRDEETRGESTNLWSSYAVVYEVRERGPVKGRQQRRKHMHLCGMLAGISSPIGGSTRDLR